jgi:TolA-binding protein
MYRRFHQALVVAAGLATLPAFPADIDAESFHRLESDVAALTESRDSLLSQIQKLREEIGKLRTENGELRQQVVASQSRDVVSREELKKVVDQLSEVDKRRAEDAKYVKAKLEDIAALAAKAPPPPVAEEPPKRKPSPPPQTQTEDDTDKTVTEYFEHQIQPGETLGAVIAAYNKDRGLKVRVADILKANPKIKDPKNLRVGTTIRIPAIK